MSNIPRYFPSGAPTNGELPSAGVEHLDSNLAKAVNGDEGSSHEGSVELGGIKAPHVTTTTAALFSWNPNGVGPWSTTRILDMDDEGIFPIVVTKVDAGIATLTLDVRNPRVGDKLTVCITVDGDFDDLVIVWAGAGITHLHTMYEDQCHLGDGVVTWTGLVKATNEIVWTVYRSG